MTNYFSPEISKDKVNSISVLGLAHLGDAVYELLVRTYLCESGHSAASDLHTSTVSMVNASFQAEASKLVLNCLTEEEKSVFKRGRNSKVNSVPANSTLSEYHAATGLETLFGWLYLTGRRERISELFSIITGEGNGA